MGDQEKFDGSVLTKAVKRSVRPGVQTSMERALCPVEGAARLIGQKWSLQIVHHLMDCESMRFCELQETLSGMNPGTLSSRLKMLEREGLIRRVQVSAIPPHVEYSLTEMGDQLDGVLQELIFWSQRWLCPAERELDRPNSDTNDALNQPNEQPEILEVA